MSATLENLSNIKWNKGYLFGSRDGGNANAIGFGALQSVDINHTIEWAILRGPESLGVLGRGQVSETISGTFEYGVITPEQFYMALGGGMAYDGGTDTTIFTKLVNEEARPFDIEVVSEPGSTPGMKVHLFRCTATSWRVMNAANRAWILGQGGFEVNGEANGGRLFTVTMPGSLINQS